LGHGPGADDNDGPGAGGMMAPPAPVGPNSGPTAPTAPAPHTTP
jgi:hypothetical protein